MSLFSHLNDLILKLSGYVSYVLARVPVHILFVTQMTLTLRGSKICRNAHVHVLHGAAVANYSTLAS